MYILVGLGNPGPKYSMNRHNVGFMLMDAIAQHLGVRFKSEHHAEVARTTLDIGKTRQEILLVKPMTFMNLSGTAVQSAVGFYKVPLTNLIVAHDEIDLPFGQLRLQKNRGHGGHNGIRDIHGKLGPDYARLRMGVGRPTIPQMNVADWVLQDFTQNEFAAMSDFLSDSLDAIMMMIEQGFEKAQSYYNQTSAGEKTK